jgi:hypothetical protein
MQANMLITATLFAGRYSIRGALGRGESSKRKRFSSSPRYIAATPCRGWGLVFQRMVMLVTMFQVAKEGNSYWDGASTF